MELQAPQLQYIFAQQQYALTDTAIQRNFFVNDGASSTITNINFTTSIYIFLFKIITVFHCYIYEGISLVWFPYLWYIQSKFSIVIYFTTPSSTFRSSLLFIIQ